MTDPRQFFLAFVGIFVLLAMLGIMISKSFNSRGVTLLRAGVGPAPDTRATAPLPQPLPPVGDTWTVYYKNGAYEPKEVNIKKGDAVKWVNSDAAPTWPASAIHPTHGVYPEQGGCPLIGGSSFDACGGLEQGKSWSFQFNFTGSWRYHDHLGASVTGVVNVTAYIQA